VQPQILREHIPPSTKSDVGLLISIVQKFLLMMPVAACANLNQGSADFFDFEGAISRKKVQKSPV